MPPGTFLTESSTAEAFVQAWAANDRSAAEQHATADAADQLLQQAWTPGNRNLGCRRDVSGDVVCSYADGTGTLGLYVAPDGDGFIVNGLERLDHG